MSLENSKTSNPYKLLLTVTDKADLRKDEKYVVLSNFTTYCT